MAVTRSWTVAGTAPVMVGVPRQRTSLRLAWLVASSLAIATGLWFVYQAKVQRMSAAPVRACQAADGRAQPGGIPRPTAAVGAPLLRRILSGGALLAAHGVPRRYRVPARLAVAYRVRLSADGQHARSAARHAGVP